MKIFKITLAYYGGTKWTFATRAADLDTATRKAHTKARDTGGAVELVSPYEATASTGKG